MGVDLRDVAAAGARPGTNTEGRRIPPSSSLPDIGADRPFARMAFGKMRRPGLNAVQHGRVENVSKPFHARREPQQFTRFGPPRNKSFLAKRTEPF